MQAKRVSASKTLAAVLAVAIALLGAVPAFGLGGTTAAQTPRTAAEARLKWSYKLKEADDFFTNVSDPVLVGGDVFIAVGGELLKLTDGVKKAQLTLAGDIDFTCRPLALGGVIYIPLSEGRLQAVTAATMAGKWVTDALPEIECTFTDYHPVTWDPIITTADLPQQSQTTLAANGGLLYFGTACADYVTSFYGTFLCVDAATGDVVWDYVNDDAGYYWAGAAFSGNAVIFAGDDGVLTSLNKATGSEIATFDLDAPVRSTVVVDGGNAYAVTQDGKLHKVPVNTDGTFGLTTSHAAFAAGSTSTPAIAGGKIYVGGMKADYSGVFAVLNTATLALEKSIAAPGYVQASPLVATAYGTPYAYYTANCEPGALYVYNGTAGAALYTPAAADRNYCMASAVAGSDGILYYTNDSGKLFAIEKFEEPTVIVDPPRTWLDKLPDWLSCIRGLPGWLQSIVYYVFFGWIWDVIYK